MIRMQVNLMLAATFVFCCTVSEVKSETKALLPKETKELLENGKILSSTTITGTDNKIADNLRAAPTDTRIHEAFIYYKNELFLCHFVGSKAAATPPYASCFGYW